MCVVQSLVPLCSTVCGGVCGEMFGEMCGEVCAAVCGVQLSTAIWSVPTSLMGAHNSLGWSGLYT